MAHMRINAIDLYSGRKDGSRCYYTPPVNEPRGISVTLWRGCSGEDPLIWPLFQAFHQQLPWPCHLRSLTSKWSGSWDMGRWSISIYPFTSKMIHTFLHVRGPEGQIVTKKLHNEGRIFIIVLSKGIQDGNSIIKGFLGQLTGTVG